jgi:uncharacterized protein YdaU (DUF1376 family)
VINSPVDSAVTPIDFPQGSATLPLSGSRVSAVFKIGLLMAKDPAFLFYTSDFLTGTSFMTDDEVGKYIRLLCYQHQHGHLPEEKFMMICKTFIPAILEKFKRDEDNLLYNIRLDAEIKKRAVFCKSRRDNINKRYNKRTSVLTSVGTSVVHMEDEDEDEDEDANDNKKY